MLNNHKAIDCGNKALFYFNNQFFIFRETDYFVCFYFITIFDITQHKKSFLIYETIRPIGKDV